MKAQLKNRSNEVQDDRIPKTLTKFWDWEKYSNIGRCKERIPEGLGVGKKLAKNSLLYTFSKKQKKSDMYSISGLA